MLLLLLCSCEDVSGVPQGCSKETRKVCESQISETVWPSYYCTLLVDEECPEGL